jgi:hypothetical protein
MRSKMGKLMASVLLLGVVFLVPALAADKPMGKCCMGKGMGMQMECPMMKKGAEGQDKMDLEEKFHGKAYFLMTNAEELGIDAAQKQKIHDIKIKAKKGLIMKEAEIEVLALDIMEMLGKEDTDLAAINKLIDKKYDIKKQKAKDLVAACVELKGVLSKDQQKKAKEMWQKQMMDKMKMGMCPMGGEKKEMMMEKGKGEAEHKGHE